MRHLLLAAVLGCCMASAAGVTEAADKKMTATELQEFRGQYDLADGRRLTVTQRGSKLFVQMDNGASVELKAAGDGAFVTLWGGVRVEFDQHENGSVTGVHLHGPDQQMARRE